MARAMSIGIKARIEIHHGIDNALRPLRGRCIIKVYQLSVLRMFKNGELLLKFFTVKRHSQFDQK